MKITKNICLTSKTEKLSFRLSHPKTHMRINNKYIRNRHFRNKHWKRIRNQSHPFETYMPWFFYYVGANYTTEQQIKDHFDWITKQARQIESGNRHGLHAPKDFRKGLNARRKAKERQILNRIRLGDYDAEMPTFKRDADWLWF